MATTKNLCAQISLDLHQKISEAREAAGLTTAQYITELLTEYFKMKENGGNITMTNNNTRSLIVGSCSLRERTERAHHVSVASAIPDKNCVTPVLTSAAICSARTAFSATHRLSVSSYFHGNLCERWPVNAQQFSNTAHHPQCSVPDSLDILVQVFQIFGLVTLDLLQNGDELAAALRFLPFRQSPGIRNMRFVFRGVDHVIRTL